MVLAEHLEVAVLLLQTTQSLELLVLVEDAERLTVLLAETVDVVEEVLFSHKQEESVHRETTAELETFTTVVAVADKALLVQEEMIVLVKLVEQVAQALLCLHLAGSHLKPL